MNYSETILRWLWKRAAWAVRNELARAQILSGAQNPGAWFVVIPYRELMIQPDGETPLHVLPNDLVTLQGNKRSFTVSLEASEHCLARGMH